MRLSFLFLLTALGVWAQPSLPDRISIGLKAGSPLNDPETIIGLGSNYKQSRWTGGPTLEFHLPYNFSIEFDALYRTSSVNRLDTYKFGENFNSFSYQSSQSTKSWDLPLLLKYRFKVQNIRPFITAGYLFTHESTEDMAFRSCLGPQGSCTPADWPSDGDQRGFYTEDSRVRKGPTGGVGLEFKTRYLTISPELRFSRILNGYPRENRFTALVGFTFGGKD